MTLKILAIDDIRDNLTVLKAVIKEAFPKAAVYMALNGKDGIELALTVDPDVILLDVVMPKIDGFEVCHQLKKNENLKHIPVVFLTALKTNRENRIKALEMGAEAFLSKPIDEQELYALVHAMAKLKAAAMQKKNEKKYLETMITERTCELEKEIEKHRQTEQELRKSEEKYRLISGLTSDYLFHEKIRDDGKVELIWVAGSFEQITGYTFDKYRKINGWRNSLHPDDTHIYDKAFKQLNQNKKVTIEVRLTHKSGKIVWVRSSGFPIWDKQKNKLKGIIGAVKDITKEKQMLDELVQAKEKAQESDRLKTAFLQNMSHELRTPLNGILGFSQLLSDPDTDTALIAQYASYIQTSGNRLLGLISNILELSKIEAGVEDIQQKTFPLNKIMRDNYAFYKPKAQKQGIKLSLHLGFPDESDHIVSDESRLTQVIMNLMDNALKFTQTGKVSLSYVVKDEEILFSLEDTGRGIPPEHQAKVFERFYQADTSFSRGYEGAGLGLPIAKGLIENLGGHMWLESTVGKGTTLYFTVPLIKKEFHKLDTMEKNIKEENNRQNKLVLIVEDDETSYYFLKLLLRRENIDVFHASDGQEAVDLCHNHPEIDLVLMDIKMRGMNGIEATQEIKLLHPELPVIAQTAYAFSTDKEAILNAGCDDYITKPIRKDELLKKMNRFLMKQPNSE